MSLESSLPAHSIHASLDVIRSTPTALHSFHLKRTVRSREWWSWAEQDRWSLWSPAGLLCMADVGTETAFRLDQRKHFWKSNHLLRSEVNWCDQTNRYSPASIYIYWWVGRSTCLASRISTQKESFPGSEFKPASIWTCWMLIDRQMQSAFMPELHRWISKLTARHLQILHQDIFWSPW